MEVLSCPLRPKHYTHAIENGIPLMHPAAAVALTKPYFIEHTAVTNENVTRLSRALKAYGDDLCATDSRHTVVAMRGSSLRGLAPVVERAGTTLSSLNVLVTALESAQSSCVLS